MPPAQPPDPPEDSKEAQDYVIKDKVYFLLYGKGFTRALRPRDHSKPPLQVNGGRER